MRGSSAGDSAAEQHLAQHCGAAVLGVAGGEDEGEGAVAGERAQGKQSHAGRNVTLLMAGIALGVLFNPATGPDTRRWLKDKLFGPEQPFDSYPSETNSSS